VFSRNNRYSRPKFASLTTIKNANIPNPLTRSLILNQFQQLTKGFDAFLCHFRQFTNTITHPHNSVLYTSATGKSPNALRNFNVLNMLRHRFVTLNPYQSHRYRLGTWFVKIGGKGYPPLGQSDRKVPK
jgi:hypothetical protein